MTNKSVFDPFKKSRKFLRILNFFFQKKKRVALTELEASHFFFSEYISGFFYHKQIDIFLRKNGPETRESRARGAERRAGSGACGFWGDLEDPGISSARSGEIKIRK